MREGGFLEQRRRSPTGFAIVVAGHAAALAAVILIKGPAFIHEKLGPISVYEVPIRPDPDPIPPPPEPDRQVPQPPQHQSVIDQFPPVIDTSRIGPIVDAGPVVDYPIDRTPPGQITIPEPEPQPTRAPVRIAAVFDPRYADALQPPYPGSEQRAEREGQVRVRVTIGTDGRVKSIERLSATSDAFWSAAERHARARWRFRPATVDGRPVESTKELTLYFRLENV